MRRKALVIGAPPSAWEGPVIGLDDGHRWLIEPQADYRGTVAVRYLPLGATDPVERLLDGEKVIIEQVKSARVIILEGARELPYETISVNVRELRAQ